MKTMQSRKFGRGVRGLVAIVTGLAMEAPLRATDNTWQSNSSADWRTAANWINGVPDSTSERAVFNHWLACRMHASHASRARFMHASRVHDCNAASGSVAQVTISHPLLGSKWQVIGAR
jgi:hypothetical protein